MQHLLGGLQIISDHQMAGFGPHLFTSRVARFLVSDPPMSPTATTKRADKSSEGSLAQTRVKSRVNRRKDMETQPMLSKMQQTLAKP